MEVNFVQEARAIDSLRKSDFDAVSAYCEVIDNSIQANSKNIKVRFDTEQNERTQIIKTLAFGDDGFGMDKESLHRCLQLGWSSRYNNRDGIGRFGVGMTLAAIHECKRVEVYSKQEGGSWLWTYIDLQEIENNDLKNIPEPVHKEMPIEFLNLVGKESGSLVLWSEYDRQEKNAKNIIEDCFNTFGRTYRYFIWDDDVELQINDVVVNAFDPLYLRTEKTKFPNDPIGTSTPDIIFNFPVSPIDKQENRPEESEIRIKLSLLPEEFRPERGSGAWKSNIERQIDQNEGISILRNRREVFYGHIPYWKMDGDGWSRWDDKDRWWGGEVHFDAVLDDSFNVKNIKRGAIPKKI